MVADRYAEVLCDPASPLALEGMTLEEVTAQLPDISRAMSRAQDSASNDRYSSMDPAGRSALDRASHITAVEGCRCARAPVEAYSGTPNDHGKPQIRREHLKRMVAATARIENRVSVLLPLTRKRWGGAVCFLEPFPSSSKDYTNMRDLTVAAAALVFALLPFLYERFGVAASIVLMALLALGAVFIGLWVRGTERNVKAVMGLRNSDWDRRRNRDLLLFGRRAVARRRDRRVAGGRWREPISADCELAAILALLPISLTPGQGSAMLKPLAIAIISGLIVQMPLMLWVMPVVFTIFECLPWGDYHERFSRSMLKRRGVNRRDG